jgi:hypothetical protein
MLQRNAQPQHAHLAHAAVVGMHVFCCGLPIAAMLLAGLTGAASASVLLPDSFEYLHSLIHSYEPLIVVVSAALVTLGGWMEIQHRRQHAHGFPWLFALSVVCFLANVAVVVAHRV